MLNVRSPISKRCIQALLALLLTTASVMSQAARPVSWPDARYNTEIPGFEQTLGYEVGTVISSHAQTKQYFQALQTARPEQIRLFSYGQTWEDRELFYAIIGSAQNIQRLDAIQRGMKQLSDPRRTDAAQAAELVQQLPASAWLSYAVHGNEISSTDAAMMTAYHLLAADQDPVVQDILANTLVFIDPIQNPDGRDRFVAGFRQARGLLPDADRFTADHDEPWPGGRTNHYHFDLNRDWLALTQPEISGQIDALLEWYPLVFVDLHEMSSDSTYYFAPEAIPYNPHIDISLRNKLPWFGQNNAQWFDQFGIDYFTREVFDAFYPGYGASWPLYYGAVAMTYEQATVRGLEIRRRDGEEISYAESVRNHFLTSIATLQTVATHRDQMLNDFYQYRQKAIDAGRKAKARTYLFNTQPDPSAVQKLASLLIRQGVEVKRSTKSFKACGEQYPSGSYWIDSAQPSHHLIRTLLDPDVPIDADFVKEQERRREKDIPHEIYDVTAWSLPLMFNVEMASCGKNIEVESVNANPALHIAGQFQALENQTPVAHLVPWGTQAAVRLMTAALRADLVIKSTDKGFTKDGRRYPAGTLIFTQSDNPENLAQQLTKLSKNTGADVIAVANSWVDEGPNFGSNHVQRIYAPKVALAWDQPTVAPGQTRYVLERQYHYPVSAIRTDNLLRADLSRYDVIILPASRGSYDSVLGARGASRLKDWVSAGGTLITLGNATRFIANQDNKLSALRNERAWQDGAVSQQAKNLKSDDNDNSIEGTRITSPDEWRQYITPLSESPDDVAGVLAYTQTDHDHWLAAGLPKQLTVLLHGNDIYAPLRLNQGRNILSYKAADELLAAGHLWDENRLQLAYKPYLSIEPMQRGFIIAFMGDPNYRAYLDGLNLAFINAVFRAPAHSASIR